MTEKSDFRKSWEKFEEKRQEEKYAIGSMKMEQKMQEFKLKQSQHGKKSRETILEGMRGTSVQYLEEKASIQQHREIMMMIMECLEPYESATDVLTFDPIILSSSMFKMAVDLMDGEDEVRVRFHGDSSCISSMQLEPKGFKGILEIDAFAEGKEKEFDYVQNVSWLVKLDDLRRIAKAIPADMYSWEYLDKDVYNGNNDEVRSHILWLMVCPSKDCLCFSIDVNRNTRNTVAGIVTGKLMTTSDLDKYLGELQPVEAEAES